MSTWLAQHQAAKRKAAADARTQKALDKAKAQAAAKAANKPTPAPTIAQARQDTTTYLDAITQQQKDQVTAYTDQLAPQITGYQGQIQIQAADLTARLDDLTQQSSQQVADYESMLQSITSQQANDLESMRRMFDTQNQQSQSMITNLQTEIQRLTRADAVAEIDVDLSPAIVGISQASKQSGKRQRLGTRGGLKTQQKTGALGLAIGT
jgi:hypothetical protein